MRISIAAALPLLWLAAPALADGPVTTAGGLQASAPAPAAAPAPLPTDDDDIMVGDDGKPVAMGACGPTHVTADGKPDSAPHGEVEAGVGTGGYRHLGGVICKPIGDNGGSVTLGVSTTQYGGGRVGR